MCCILRSSRSLITQKRLVGEKTYKNKSCLSRRFTSNKVNFFWLRSMVSELSSILMILGCTSLLLEAHHRTIGRRGRRNLNFFPSLYLGYRMGIQTPQFVRNISAKMGRSRVTPQRGGGDFYTLGPKKLG